MAYVPETTKKIPEHNHKKLFCYPHSGSKHISQLPKVLSTLNREFSMHPLNCTRIIRCINIMFNMWHAFFIIWKNRVWKQVPELFHMMYFFRFVINSIFYTNNTIPGIIFSQVVDHSLKEQAEYHWPYVSDCLLVWFI